MTGDLQHQVRESAESLFPLQAQAAQTLKASIQALSWLAQATSPKWANGLAWSAELRPLQGPAALADQVARAGWKPALQAKRLRL